MLLVLSIAVIVLVLVLIEGFFSGSETVFTSASKTFLHGQAEKGEPRAALAREILARPELFLGTTLIGTNLAVVSSTTLAHVVIGQYAPTDWQNVLNTLIMTPLILIVGELLPKSIGRARADALALRLARSLKRAEWVLYPLVVLAGKLAGAVAALTGARGSSGTGASVTRDDLRAVAELAVEQGLIPESAGSMLDTVFGLDRQPVSSIMVPLVDVSSVPLDASVERVERLSVEAGYSRFPVYQGRVDEIVGVVDLRQLLYALTAEGDGETPQPPSAQITPFVQRNVVFVPETKSVGALLDEMRYQKIPMAVVVDEHGGVVGIVTAEDLIEEVVGEIHDERDRPLGDVTEVAAEVYECDGRLQIDELADRLGIEITKEGFETVAGFVLSIAGRIPVKGDKFRYRDYEVEVVDVVRRRVARLLFRRLPIS